MMQLGLWRCRHCNTVFAIDPLRSKELELLTQSWTCIVCKNVNLLQPIVQVTTHEGEVRTDTCD